MENQITILYGNGINRLGNGMDWRTLLNVIGKGRNIPDIQNNTYLYEYIVLPIRLQLRTADGDKLCEKEGKGLVVKNVDEEDVKKRLQEKLVDGDSWFMDKMIDMKANHYLTTNYEMYLNEKYTIDHKKGYNQPYTGVTDLLYKHEVGKKNGREVTLWNIHGSVKEPQSILLGLHEYCKYVGAIDHYIKNRKEVNPSWVDLFFTTNVHIIGFGFGYEEIDLWYVLISRMRRIKEGEKIDNTIYFYDINDERTDEQKKISEGKRRLLEAAGVEVVNIEFNLETKDYTTSYRLIIEEYKKRECI